MSPKARTNNLTIRELPGETVIYDLAAKKVHCLNRVALFVWKHADGRTSVGDLATRLAEELAVPSAYEAVELALEQLSKRGLLQTAFAEASAARKSDRRAVLKRLAALAAIPTVLTLAAPKAMAQRSGTVKDCEKDATASNRTQCQNNGQKCTFYYCSGTNSNQIFSTSGTCQGGSCHL